MPTVLLFVAMCKIKRGKWERARITMIVGTQFRNLLDEVHTRATFLLVEAYHFQLAVLGCKASIHSTDIIVTHH